MARLTSFASTRSFGGGILKFDWRPDAEDMAERVMNVADALRTTALPLAAAAEVVSADIRENFAGQHDPEGRPWEEWSESYAPYAASHNIGGILEQTMELYDAATDEGALFVSDDALFYDMHSLPERGIWHQEGRNREKGGDLPARPFLGMSDEAANEIFITFSRWFDRSIDLFVTSRGRIGRRHRARGPMGRFVGAS